MGLLTFCYANWFDRLKLLYWSNHLVFDLFVLPYPLAYFTGQQPCTLQSLDCIMQTAYLWMFGNINSTVPNCFLSCLICKWVWFSLVLLSDQIESSDSSTARQCVIIWYHWIVYIWGKWIKAIKQGKIYSSWWSSFSWIFNWRTWFCWDLWKHSFDRVANCLSFWTVLWRSNVQLMQHRSHVNIITQELITDFVILIGLLTICHCCFIWWFLDVALLQL